MESILNAGTQLEFVFRLFVAGICGVIVGLERRNRSKEAGIRTHFIVACGAALMMLVSKYAFFDVIKSGLIQGADIRLDPSRIASTIASGIGFLGAGMIFVHRNTITGLTTAAGIWATSGIGMAIGAGLYYIGISATILIVLAQIILHMNLQWKKFPKTKILVIRNVHEENYQETITNYLAEKKISVRDVAIDYNREQELRKYTLTIELPIDSIEEEIITGIGYDVSIKTSV